jgi:hypothetical protein
MGKRMPCPKARPLVITWWLCISYFTGDERLARQRASLSGAFEGRPYLPDGPP